MRHIATFILVIDKNNRMIYLVKELNCGKNSSTQSS